MRSWIKSALIRAIKTVCQTAVASIGTAAALSDVDWRFVLSASVLAGVLSILTSCAGLPEVDVDNSDAVEELTDDKEKTGEEENEEVAG
jgi:hypothetical protein